MNPSAADDPRPPALLAMLERRLAGESSLFRAQLLREDIARLRKLDALARSAADAAGYRQAARKLGWTALDARTGELGEALDRLLDLWRLAVSAGEDPPLAAQLLEAWEQLTQLRLERLVGCLSTPVPKFSE